MSAERFTLDANILIYAVDKRAGRRHETAFLVVERAASRDCWLATQSLSEFFSIAVKKMRMPRPIAAQQVRDWMMLFPGIDASRRALTVALAEAEAGRFSFWDALFLATASDSGCRIVLSEDMADGAQLGNVTVRTPFDSSGAMSEAGLTLLDLR